MMIVSGGARGVDSYAADLARKKGMVVKTIKPIQNTAEKYTRGLLVELDMVMHIEGTEKLLEANKTLKRHVSDRLLRTGLLQRNYHIIQDVNVVLALGHFENREKQILQGGTGWSVQMAIDAKKPVYVYIDEDECWYVYNYTEKLFVPSFYPTLDKECTAIVGSRHITDNMKLQLKKFIYC